MVNDNKCSESMDGDVSRCVKLKDRVIAKCGEFLDKNSFITVSFCVTLACVVFYFIGTCSRALPISALILLFLNNVLSICCWLQKKHSPYRTALFAVNLAVLILLGFFFLVYLADYV